MSQVTKTLRFACDVGSDLREELLPLLTAQGFNVVDDDAGGNDEQCYHVFSCFEGNEYDRLRTQRRQVIGVPCLRHVLSAQVPLPDASRIPLYSLALIGVVVCCSSMPAERKLSVQTRVCMMGGKSRNHLKREVTHLICPGYNADSEKYRVAASLHRVHVVTPLWVDSCWHSETRAPEMHHVAPPFLDMVVALVRFEEADARRLTRSLERGGATVSQGGITQHCSHIVVGPVHSSTQLRPFGAAVVTQDWVLQSVSRGAALPTSMYPVASASKGALTAHVGFSGERDKSHVESYIEKCGLRLTDALHEAQYIVAKWIGALPSSNVTAVVVSIDWLVECVSAKTMLPYKNFPVPSDLPDPGLSLKHERPGVFTGVEACVSGYPIEEQVQWTTLLTKHGCIVLGDRESQTADYFIVPDGHLASGAERRCASHRWVELCIELNQLLPLNHPIHCPMRSVLPIAEMAEINATLSGFEPVDKRRLILLLRDIGAKYSNNMKKRSTTHLITKRASGSKYAAAQKRSWDIVCVTAPWLEECAQTGQVLSARKFSPDATDPRDPFTDLLVLISPSLPSKEKTQLSELISSLGGDLAIKYDDHVTHVVHRGPVRPKFKAKMHHTVFCVSPDWVTSSYSLSMRSNETEFPCEKDGNRSLTFVGTLDRRTSSISSKSSSGRKHSKRRSPSMIPLATTQQQQRQKTPKVAHTAASFTTLTETPIKSPEQRRLVDTPPDFYVAADPSPPETVARQAKSPRPPMFNSVLDNVLMDLQKTLAPENDVVRKRKSEEDQGELVAKSVKKMAARFDRQSLRQDEECQVAAAAGAGAAPLLERGASQEIRYYDSNQTLKQRSLLQKSMAGGDGRKKRRKGADPDDSKHNDEDDDEGDGGHSASLPAKDDNDGLLSSSGDDEEEERERVFTFSKWDPHEYRKLAAAVERLGARVSSEFEPGRTTHVVVPMPSRTIKFLAGLVSGCWCLERSFVDDSLAAGAFVSERGYQWTEASLASSCSPRRSSTTQDTRRLASVCSRWRALAEGRRAAAAAAAAAPPPLLDGWNVIVVGNSKVAQSFATLCSLLGGVALYYGMKPLWSKWSDSLTHVIVETTTSVLSPHTEAELRRLSVPVLSERFVLECIMRAALPSRNDYVWTPASTLSAQRRSKRVSSGAAASSSSKSATSSSSAQKKRKSRRRG